MAGERSGLWREYARIIGELRPRYVIVENVAALLSRGLGDVLRDLAALGFDAEWHCIPASAVGAPHRRDRVWIVAYAKSERRGEARGNSERHEERPAGGSDVLADANQVDAQGFFLERYDQIIRREQIERQARLCSGEGHHQDWSVEPAVGRVAHGVPDRVGQLRAYGNAVVPQISESEANAELIVQAVNAFAASRPAQEPVAWRDALEHVTELLVDSWEEYLVGDAETETAVIEARRLLSISGENEE
jgi:DNA (cytosine-5)-methyltransferase 1